MKYIEFIVVYNTFYNIFVFNNIVQNLKFEIKKLNSLHVMQNDLYLNYFKLSKLFYN